MAYGNIKIEYHLRPCLVRINSEEFKKALFHRWTDVSELVGASPLRGGHPGGQISDTFAIVEFEEGNVLRVNIEDIIFLDSGNQFADFAWDYIEDRLHKTEVNDRK